MIHLVITTANIPQEYAKRKQQIIDSIEACLSFRQYFDSYTVLECVSAHEDYLGRYPTYYSQQGNPFKDKGHNELNHLRAFLNQSGLPDDASIVKLSGKYLVTDDYFFKKVNMLNDELDSMFKSDSDVYAGNGYHTFLYYIRKGLLLDAIDSISLNDSNERPIEWDFKDFLMVRDRHAEIDRLGVKAFQGAASENIFIC